MRLLDIVPDLLGGDPPPPPVLTPPPATSRPSVARVVDDWYVVCRSDQLRTKPLAMTLLGTPLVLFRGEDGVPGALLDRCPHRNVPLSIGAVRGDRLRCGYHGWELDRQGCVKHIPCLIGEPDAKARRVPSYAAREQDGYIWVYGSPDVQPERTPYKFPGVDEPGYAVIRTEVDLEGSVFQAAENALDVPHTAYLHGGLFRQAERNHEIEVVVRRWHDRCEAEYVGEPSPTGLLGRILAPKGGDVVHYDRFILPCITQVEYRLGNNHLWVHSALTPLRDFSTRLFGLVAIKLPSWLPARSLGQVLKPLGLFVLGQDARMLRHQTRAIRRFGGEQLVSTDVDCLGPHILRLLRDAEGGRRGASDEPVQERRVRMRV